MTSKRILESRTNEARTTYDMDYVNPLTLPSELKKEGYHYRWVQYACNGEPTYRVEEMTKQGWEHVSPTELKSQTSDPLGRNPLAQQVVMHKDVLLMRRKAELGMGAKERFRALNDNKVKSLKGVRNDLGATGIRGV